MEPATRFALRARYLFPVDQPPLAHGVITVDSGRIVAVGSNESDHPPRDLGDCAILPGLINAHTHLEFSGLSAPLGSPGIRFPDWIRRIVARRRSSDDFEQAVLQNQNAVAAGLNESLACGVTFLGEIATAGWSPQPFSESPLRLTIFRELLGLAEERQQKLLETADGYTDARQVFKPNVTVGVSPHSPYTVRPELIDRVARLAAEKHVIVAMHLAETTEELELLASASGPLVELLTELEAWPAGAVPRGIRPYDYLQMLSQAPRSLVIHGNYLTSEEIGFLAERRARMSVVYCPRTHAFFGHASYPLAEMLHRGASVVLGTDSRASSPDLSLLAEMRFVRDHHDVAPAAVLRMGTLEAARAFGIDHDCGTLAPGKRADLAIVALPESTDSSEPHDLLFDPGSHVVQTYIHGILAAESPAAS
jgi:cytosine/adenosine deaminase-related metal-dependent hydrolase